MKMVVLFTSHYTLVSQILHIPTLSPGIMWCLEMVWSFQSKATALASLGLPTTSLVHLLPGVLFISNQVKTQIASKQVMKVLQNHFFQVMWMILMFILEMALSFHKCICSKNNWFTIPWIFKSTLLIFIFIQNASKMCAMPMDVY